MKGFNEQLFVTMLLAVCGSHFAQGNKTRERAGVGCCWKVMWLCAPVEVILGKRKKNGQARKVSSNGR